MSPRDLTLMLRRLVKALHTIGGVGFMGGMAALAAVVTATAPAAVGTAGYATLAAAMARIAAWVIGPSMVLAVTSGLLAMAINPGFYDVGWVWLKAGTGILILEGGLHVMGPLQEEAKRGAGAAAVGAAEALRLLAAEANTLWMLLAVSAANVALAVWRPRLLRLD